MATRSKKAPERHYKTQRHTKQLKQPDKKRWQGYTKQSRDTPELQRDAKQLQKDKNCHKMAQNKVNKI